MREFELSIDEALSVGLRKDEYISLNSQVLTTALNFRCGSFRLEPYVLGSNPLPSALDMYYYWPFPQFVSGERFNILIVRDNAILVDTVYIVSDDYSSISQIAAIDALTFGQGGLMEVADFGSYAFMTNGVVMIYRDPTVGSWGMITSHPSIPMMSTICNFKGQAVGGGILSSWHSCDKSYIVWSNIGEMNFTIDSRNEAGYRREPFGGEVQHVRRLGDLIAIFSDKGISTMKPADSTFGFEELLDKGLINKGAVNGSVFGLVFVDSSYDVWRMSIGGKLENLGYSEYMLNLINDIIVSYNSLTGDYYISDGITTYLLSPSGLTEITQHPSAVWNSHGSTYLLPSISDDELPTLVTGPFDMGMRGHKTIFTIEVGFSGVIAPKVAIEWKLNQEIPFARSSWIPVNQQGVATLIVSGVEFRICARFDDVTDMSSIGYLKIRYKMTDLRSIRGVYAPPPRGQG